MVLLMDELLANIGDKHSSLFCIGVSDEEKKFLALTPVNYNSKKITEKDRKYLTIHKILFFATELTVIFTHGWLSRLQTSNFVSER
jgi:hypothetical protein